MSMILDGSLGVTFNDASLQGAAASPFVLKNRIINGDMVIDQRNNGASVTPTNGQYSVDRWISSLTQASKYSVQQNAGSVTPPVGFTNYLGVTSLSAYSIITTDVFTTVQRIEGYNTSDLAWGTANASPVTLSFWVRSSLTGTFGGSLRNGAANRSYPFTYTISVADTWEYKTITIAGDTSGTWLTTNGVGINVFFSLGAGSTFSGTAGAWAAGNFNSATGATSVVGTSGATWYITGVQLEQNTSATPFERRLYGQELANCQRYYGKFVATSLASNAFFGAGISNTTSQGGVVIQFPQTMRSSPTISISQLALTDATNYDANVTVIASQNSCTTSAKLVLTTSATMTALRTAFLIAQSGTAGYVDFSAEL